MLHIMERKLAESPRIGVMWNQAENAAAARKRGYVPAKFRNGSKNAGIRFAIGECSLGFILAATSERGICAILLGNEPEALVHDLEERFPHAELTRSSAASDETIAEVVRLAEAPGTGLTLPLDVRGTAFQRKVWQALQEIPPGKTASYAEIAERIGAPKSVRAVAGAIAANPIAIAIPCHRAVRKDGSLGGYHWGAERKRVLLEREKQR
jgi:AraC family transcriptional regulator of adaptative response/methylated-DNA-[protein]-cysteine methyltransferase